MAITWNGGCGKGGGAIYMPGPGIQINSQNEISADVRRGMITLPEVSPAESAHAVDEYLIFNNGLYRVDAAIAIGDTLVPGTNITPTSVGRELSSLKQSLAIETVLITPTSNVLSGNISCRRIGKIVLVEGYAVSLNATGLQTVATGMPVADVSTPLSTTVWAGAMVGDIYIPTGTDRLLTNYSGGYFAFSMMYIQ